MGCSSGRILTTILFVAQILVAQQDDALVAAANRYRLAYENSQVRLIQVGPGGGKVTPGHSHPGYPFVSVALTEIHSITTNADGSSRESHREARTVRYTPGGARQFHMTRQLTDQASRALRIESKLQRDPAQTQAPALADTHFAVEQDNEDFRVTRAKFAPVERVKLKLSVLRPAVVVFFGRQRWGLKDQRGHSSQADFIDGSFLFMEPGRFELSKKLDNSEAEFVVVELKGRLN